MTIQEWCEINSLQIELDSKLVTIKGVEGKYLYLEPREKMVKGEFYLNLTSLEESLIERYNIQGFIFFFGSKWYCSKVNISEVKDASGKYIVYKAELTLFKYIGEPNLQMNYYNIPHLGIHGGYELCNGSRDYRDWCRKAKFLGVTSLGICEENTLAGAINFQNTCSKFGIKPIIGETITVRHELDRFSIKLYINTEEGFRNLLRISNTITCSVERYIEIEELFKYSKGLTCILTPEVDLGDGLLEKFLLNFPSLFYQLDFVEWESQDRDRVWLENIKYYLDNLLEVIEPILLVDSYYLDKEDFVVKKLLNRIGGIGFKSYSSQQYFKNIDELFAEFSILFNQSDERQFNIFDKSIENLNKLVDSVDFKIKTGNLFLPKYEMNEEESSTFKDNDELFYSLIERGFEEKIKGRGLDEDKYWDRLDKEIGVISKGGFIDYFLILGDVISWCGRNNIWVGLGRGSAAGALTSYILGIVGIDPLKYNLLFERFLNETRITKGLPDIDLDFADDRRDEVKNYIRTKYGLNSVTAIGTYTSLKLKAAFKALCREYGVEPQTANYLTAVLDASDDYTGLFKTATTVPQLKEFIQSKGNMIELLPLILNQAGNSSMHAAGMVITPKLNDKGESMEVYDWMPVKKMGDLVVSEWEGSYLDQVGFLKCDILGLAQLKKFAKMNELIQQHHGLDIRYDDIDLDNSGVFKLFQEGHNEDVFQLTGYGLRGYCKDLKPENIEDLIATISLYRPGPIEMNAHKDYVKIKNGMMEPRYDFKLRGVTEKTFGLWVYQEQIMEACQVLAGFTLVEADDIRKAMGKMLPELIASYKDKFISGAIKNECSPEEAASIWQKLVVFGGYGFNRSHAACYAIMGYFSQWFKLNYPLEFWTTSLEFSESDEIIDKIAEIEKLGVVKVSPVDINKSQPFFFPEVATNNIYWSLSSIKNVGGVGVETIMQERESGGRFTSLQNLIERVEKRKVNKRSVVHLILAGAFDEIEKLVNYRDRFLLIKKYLESLDCKPEDIQQYENLKDYEWVILQKKLTGFGYIDFSDIIKKSELRTRIVKFLPIEELQFEEKVGREVLVTGILKKVTERKSSRGEFCQLDIEYNSTMYYITLWNESYAPIKEKLNNSLEKLIIVEGKVVRDNYKSLNVIHSTNTTEVWFI